MRFLALTFDAPLVSFGGALVDEHNVTDRFPGTAMIVGLLGNALGYSHGDLAMLTDLQLRLTFAARWDVPPTPLRDYHTVDLGQPHLREPGWTTNGGTEHRQGALASKYGTHQRYRHYWSDGVMKVAVALGVGEPNIDQLARAVARPARPLFLGRKTCLPAAPVLGGVFEAADLKAAIDSLPRHARAGDGPLEAIWPYSEGDEDQSLVERTDARDWRTQVHVGVTRMTGGFCRAS